MIMINKSRTGMLMIKADNSEISDKWDCRNKIRIKSNPCNLNFKKGLVRPSSL